MVGLPASSAAQGQLTIGSVEMICPAWWVLDLSTLFDFPDPVGENVRIPQRGGRRAYRRWPDATTYRLPMLVTGVVDLTGEPNDFPRVGLGLNHDYLLENVVAMEEATQQAVWDLEDGSQREADVQASIVFGETSNYERPATLYVTVVSEAGRFEVVGS